MFSDEETSKREGERGLFQVRYHSRFQSVKQVLKIFRKIVSVFRAKLVSVPALWLKWFGCFDLCAHQKGQKKSHQRRRCGKRTHFRVRIVQNVSFGILRITNKRFFCGIVGNFALLRFNVFENSILKKLTQNISKGVLPFGKVTVGQRFEM